MVSIFIQAFRFFAFYGSIVLHKFKCVSQTRIGKAKIYCLSKDAAIPDILRLFFTSLMALFSPEPLPGPPQNQVFRQTRVYACNYACQKRNLYANEFLKSQNLLK